MSDSNLIIVACFVKFASIISWVIHADEAMPFVGKTFFIFRQFFVYQILFETQKKFNKKDEDHVEESGLRFCNLLYTKLVEVYERKRTERIQSFLHFTYEAAFESTDEELDA